MKTIGLVVKPDPEARKKADELAGWLTRKGVGVLRRQLYPHGEGATTDDVPAPDDLFCVLVLGGDGTFLGAARWIGRHPIPILGVKFGEVGFLADILEDRLFEVAENILANNFRIDPRMRLRVRVIRDGNEIADDLVLNDVVINKGSVARLADIETHVNDRYLTHFRCDGLIVATPTGSTAYSLAAGGPVLHPAVPGILLTPICPFTLTNRPLILPDTATIRIRGDKKTSNLMATFDGQVGVEICAGDVVLVEKSQHPVHMITMPGQNYFDVLKTKLRWSGGR